MYYCAKPEKRKKVATLLIPATITAVLCGITEPIEFTFLFVAPILYVVPCRLSGYLVGDTLFHRPVGQLRRRPHRLLRPELDSLVPLSCLDVYFTDCHRPRIHGYLLRRLPLPHPSLRFAYAGRTDDGGEDKLFTKAEYKAKKEMEKKGIAGGADALKAQVFLDCLGGPDNIREVTNCATRLRVTVNDPDKVAATSKFTNAGAFGLVKNGHAIQVIVGLSVPNVRGHFDASLKGMPQSQKVQFRKRKKPRQKQRPLRLLKPSFRR